MGGIVGGVVGQSQDTQRTATMSLLINPLEGNPFSPVGRGDQLINMRTEAELVKSTTVAEIVNDQLDADLEVSALFGPLRVTTPENTQILDIEYSDSDASVAVERAQAVGEAFLEYRQRRAQAGADSQRVRVEEQIQDRLAERQEAIDELADSGETPADDSLLGEQVRSLTAQIDLLRARLIDLQSVPPNPGEVITPASVPPQSRYGMGLILGAAGLIAGAGTGTALALMRLKAAGRFHRPDDLVRLGMPVLGIVDAQAIPSHLDDAVLVEPSDDLRRLRNSLVNLVPNRAFTLLISSPTGEEMEGVALGLASAFAHANYPTLLVALDHRRTVSRNETSTSDLPGLSDVLEGTITTAKATLAISETLALLPPGTAGQHDEADMLLSPEMANLLTEHKNRGFVVILSSSDVSHVRTMAVASMVDFVALEAQEGLTTHRSMNAAIGDCGVFPGELLGAIYVHSTTHPRQRSNAIRNGGEPSFLIDPQPKSPV